MPLAQPTSATGCGCNPALATAAALSQPIDAALLQHCRQGSGTDTGSCLEVDLDELMIPIRFLMLSRLMSSAWTVGAIALVSALLLEWGLIVADSAGVS